MAGYELIGEEEKKAIMELFDKGFILHRYGFNAMRHDTWKVAEFEKAFAKKINARHAQAVTSGTAALKVALRALNIKPGDEVITSCFTFVATIEAIIDAGAVPVICDIDETLNIDAADVESKITDRTRAIVPIHMLGAAADMDRIMKISSKHKIPVLEDACQALGATHRGKYLGTIGQMGAFSFDFGKVITTGEGGMIATNDEELYRLSSEYADHGHQNKSNLPRNEDTRRIGGFNYRMNELQGALGLVQLSRLDFIIDQQRKNKEKIKNGLRKTPNIVFRKFVDEKGEAGDTFVFFLKNEEDTKKFFDKLTEAKIGTKILQESYKWHFAGTWDHMLKAYPQYKNPKDLWQKSAKILNRSIAIPIFVKMTDERINYIIKTIDKIARSL